MIVDPNQPVDARLRVVTHGALLLQQLEAVRFEEPDEFGECHALPPASHPASVVPMTRGDRLVGRIEWDDRTGGRVLALVVDGKAFSWDEVGRMLMTLEGFTLHARVEDSIEVVGGPLLQEPDPGRVR
jgi:hypothetical protein